MEPSLTSAATQEVSKTNFIPRNPSSSTGGIFITQETQEFVAPPAQENKNFLLKSKFIFAKLFFLLNIFFIFVIIFSPIDSHFGLCSYDNQVECYPLFWWYSSYVVLLKGGFILIFFSAFIGFPPVVLFVWLYFWVLTNLFKKIKSTEDLIEAKLIKVLTVSTILFPILFISSSYLVGWNVSTPQRKLKKVVELNKKIVEQKVDEISSGNQDFCVDAPEDIFLYPQKGTFGNPALYFPPGYWAGIGVVQISKENSWDGTTNDSEFIFYTNDQLTNFSSSHSLSLYRRNSSLNDPNTNIPDIKIGQKYDVRVSTIKKDQIPTVFNNLNDIPIIDVFKFSFKDGIFAEKFENRIQFGVSSSTRINKEKCLSVTVKDNIALTNLSKVHSTTYIVDGQIFKLINGKATEVDSGTKKYVVVSIFGYPLYDVDINGDRNKDVALVLTKTFTNSNGAGRVSYYAAFAIAEGETYKTSNIILLGDVYVDSKAENGISPPQIEINNGEVFYKYYEVNYKVNSDKTLDTPKYVRRSMLVTYDKNINQIDSKLIDVFLEE